MNPIIPTTTAPQGDAEEWELVTPESPSEGAMVTQIARKAMRCVSFVALRPNIKDSLYEGRDRLIESIPKQIVKTIIYDGVCYYVDKLYLDLFKKLRSIKDLVILVANGDLDGICGRLRASHKKLEKSLVVLRYTDVKKLVESHATYFAEQGVLSALCDLLARAAKTRRAGEWVFAALSPESVSLLTTMHGATPLGLASALASLEPIEEDPPEAVELTDRRPIFAEWEEVDQKEADETGSFGPSFGLEPLEEDP